MVLRALSIIIINCLICTCTCATYSWEMLHSGQEGIDPSVINKVCVHSLRNNNSQLTLSIKASVRLFSSYQNDVGASKSVSWETLLRSLIPAEKAKNVTVKV